MLPKTCALNELTWHTDLDTNLQVIQSNNEPATPPKIETRNSPTSFNVLVFGGLEK